jgi:hypothetical protein
MTLRMHKRLSATARKYPYLRPFIAYGSAFACTRARSGIIYVADDDMLPTIMRVLNRDAKRKLIQYENEILADAELRQTYEAAVKRFSLTKYKDWTDRTRRLRGNLSLYYGAVRELQPEIIVETGTATGSMTSYLLAALARNGKGKLISIDLPPVAGSLTMDITVAQSDVGYFIPLAYRDRWDYRMGDAKELLPKVLIENRVEMFVHDSLHTPAHMMFEYAVARALLPENALVVSDDIGWNEVFGGFLKTQGVHAYVPFGNMNIGAFLNQFSVEEREIGIGIVRRPTKEADAR